jgi:hypothetical protein
MDVAIAKCIQRDLGYKGTVINMQYFVKHPIKITAPHHGAYFEDNDSDILTF